MNRSVTPIGRPMTRVRFRWNDMRDPAPARAHVHHLRSVGMTHCMIARSAGISERTIDRLGRGETKTVSAPIAEAILKVTPRPSHHQAFVLAYGARRRLEALAYAGHNLRRIAEEMGVANAHAQRLRSAKLITWETHVAVDAVFRALWDKPGHDPRTLAHAQRNRYLPALAWEDIDDYHETPDRSMVRKANTRSGDEARQNRLKQVDNLTKRGFSASAIAARLNMSNRQVTRYRAELRNQQVAS